jgi:hypothetical protein
MYTNICTHIERFIFSVPIERERGKKTDRHRKRERGGERERERPVFHTWEHVK